MAEKKSEKYDLVDRTKKGPSPLATATFVGLRAADPVLQWGILARGVGSHIIYNLGGHTIPHGTHIEALELSPYRLILLAMATGSSLKQIFFQVSVAEIEITVGAAAAVSVANTICNSLNDLFFTCSYTTAALGEDPHEYGFPSVPLVVGSIAYVVGILAETVSEVQRRNFKRDPNNKGKVFTGGLFSLSRHINYAGFVLWRFGYATAAAGFTWGLIYGAWQSYDFARRAIPILDDYCGNRYGEQWTDYKKQVPYKLFPGIY